MRCTRVYEDADPAPWGDNFLCAPSNALFTLSWSQAGAIPGKACTRVYEAADPHSWGDNFLCVGVSFPIAGDRDDAVANGRMRTSFMLNADGSLAAVTNTRTGVQLAGFTGASSIILLDENRQPIWASSVHSYGVDGCTIGRCNRNENWSENVPQSVMGRVRGYAILQQHDPSWRIFDRANQFLGWLNSNEGRSTIGTIASIAAML